MGQHAADLAGVAEVPVTIEDSAKGLVKQVSIIRLLRLYRSIRMKSI